MNADQIPADGGCGWENADRKMRMEKNADNKTNKKKKREMRITKKINKQTIKERNLSFK